MPKSSQETAPDTGQLNDLDIGGDTVNKLRAEWINRVYAPTIRPGEELAKKKIPLTAVVGLEDRIVTFDSARSFFQDPEPETVPGDHIDMKLPKDRDATCYLVLLRVLKHHDDPADALQLLQRYATGATRTVPKRPAGKRFRLIGFDADGTLLRGDGFQYSWSLVWKHLGVPDAVWKAARRTFLEKGRTFAAYQEWCAHDLQHLKMRGLRREDFKAITSSIHPTHYLRETIGILRSEGFTLAIISGGIDTFLYEIIPDTKELFDYVCINSFHYDDRGIISAIDPSPFDFIGKADALKALCKYHGAELSESVFVGEGYNDGAVGEVAGLCIAYPPDSEDITAPARVEITEDDLRKILDHVL